MSWLKATRGILSASLSTLQARNHPEALSPQYPKREEIRVNPEYSQTERLGKALLAAVLKRTRNSSPCAGYR